MVDGEKGILDALAAGLYHLDSDEITVLVIENELLFDDRPLRSHSLQLAPFVRTMRRLGIERLTLAAGLGKDECRDLIDGLARCSEIVSSAHAHVGRVYLREGAGGSQEGELPFFAATPPLEEVVDEVEESFLLFERDPASSMEQLDRMLWRLVEGLDQTSRKLLLLNPMRSFDQRLFVHSINVALLALAQARALGIQDQVLHDVGLASLLHDIGKLSLPQEVVNKRERLTEEESEVLRLHPELGAAKLCGIPEVPHLAVLVAYEHHLRWDGKPSFPVPSTPRTPNVASQLTAIANTFDVMIAGRGLSGRADDDATLKVWQERSETYLDPFLVGSFVMMVSEARSRLDSGGSESPD
jgi:hypothetical protein